jgi:hypothetical protein
MKPFQFGFSSHAPKAQMSSSVQTLMALQQGLKTHEDFLFTPEQESIGFRNQTQILAYYLMSLWMPKPAELRQNYLGLIRSQKLYFKGQLKKIEDVPVERMRENLSQSHLGALTFFNLLFSGHPEHNHLSLLESCDGHCLFTQALQTFWMDYFFPKQNPIHLFSPQSLEEKMQFFFKKHPQYFSQLTQGLSIRKIFMPEIFQIFFRIYTTPFSLIEKIAHQVIDEKYHTELKKFLKYLAPKLDLLLDRFENYLSPEERQAWSTFQKNQGRQEFLNYSQGIDDFFHYYPLLSTSQKNLEKQSILAYTLNLGTPHMEEFLHAEQVLEYTPEVQEYCFVYMYDLVRNAWDEVRQDPQHLLWSIFNNFCTGIPHNNSHIKINPTSDVVYLLAKSIVFHFNYLAKFLINQSPTLSRMTNIFYHLDDPRDIKIKNHSIFYIALLSQNLEIIQVLNPYHLTLNKEEVLDLQQIIWNCISQNQKDLFQFILRHYEDILNHINQDMLSFRSLLETHCMAYAPEFFPLIPQQTNRRIHFLSPIHIGIYSDTSDSDEDNNYGSSLCTNV